MTNPRDAIAGHPSLIDEIRYLASPDAERMSDFQRINMFVTVGCEAAAALDAFQAKVKELEVVIAHTEYRSDNCDAENYSLYNRLTAAESRATRAEQERNELQGMLLLCGELGGIWNDETPLAYLRRLIDGLIDAQQERDEAYERAAIAVRRRAFNTPYGWDKGQEVWREACEHVEADIRRLAAGTEKEGE